MTIKMSANWSKPIALKNGEREGLIYTCDLESLPKEWGVYVLGRKFGPKVDVFYVGRTNNLRSRIKGHLNSLKLMKSISEASAGKRILLYCTFSSRSDTRKKKACRILEEALINHFLTDGHELFQKQGTKRPHHTFEFAGNRTSEAIVPRKMLIRA